MSRRRGQAASRVCDRPGCLLLLLLLLCCTGPAILHGINQVLLPDLPPDPNQLPAPLGDEGELEQPPDADAPEQAGPVSLEEAAKDIQRDEADGVSQPSASTAQQGRIASGAAATASAAAAGTGQRAGTGAGATTSTTSSSNMAGMARSSIRPAATGAGADSMPTAAVAVGPVGTGIRAAGSGPVTTEKGPSGAAAVAGVAGTPKKPSVWVPDADTAGTLGRRLLLRLLPPRSMLAAARQSRRLLAVQLQTAGRVLTGMRGLLQLTTTQRPKPRAVDTTTAAGGVVTPSGALSSAVNVGAIGELQSFVNGVAANKMLQALRRAGQSKIPQQYVNRYGSFRGAAAKGGCLNCKAWGQPE